MNLIEANPNALPFAGENNCNYEPRLELLRWSYLFAGLPPENALEAAIADYEELFNSAA